MPKDATKLEAMLVHLLNEKGPTGRLWVGIQVEGFPRFTREDVENELAEVRKPQKWYSKLLK
jgi:hypothetical protein